MRAYPPLPEPDRPYKHPDGARVRPRRADRVNAPWPLAGHADESAETPTQTEVFHDWERLVRGTRVVAPDVDPELVAEPVGPWATAPDPEREPMVDTQALRRISRAATASTVPSPPPPPEWEPPPYATQVDPRRLRRVQEPERATQSAEPGAWEVPKRAERPHRTEGQHHRPYDVAERRPPEGQEPPPPLAEHGTRIIALPSTLREAVAAPPMRAVLGALLIGLVVALVMVGRWWFAERSATEEQVPAAGSAAATVSGQAGPATGESPAERVSEANANAEGSAPGAEATVQPAPTTPAAELTIHVAGAVTKPGVVRVPSGSRVMDVIEGAGGLAPDAEPAAINLARPAVDGEQIVVTKKGEAPVAAPAAPPVPGGTAASGAAGAPGAGAGGVPGGKVNLNTADQATLETLPGVGPVLAGRIIQWRTENGGFTRVEDLDAVSGVGEKTFARLAPLVTV